MLGNLVNLGAILIGSLIGLLLKKGIKEEHVENLNKAIGVGVLIIGLNGIVGNMVSLVKDGEAFTGALSSSGELLLVCSLIIGTFIGSVLKIDERFNSLAGKIENKFHLTGFASGFVYATILYCVGAMAILGGIQDGLGNPTILYTKAILDGVTAIMLTSTMGIGVLFSAITTFIYQGIIVLLTKFGLSHFLQGELLSEVCFVGYALIMCIGFNFFIKDKFKTANMLPAVLIPIIWYLLKLLFNVIFA